MILTALSCIALNVYFEARSDNMSGQYAVAHVVLNRVQDNRWPNEVCEVVTQRNDNNVCQFSWYCDGLSDRPKDITAYLNSVDVAEKTLHGLKDVVKGSIYYHSVKVKPWWAKYKIRVRQIGDHIFYK